MTPTIAAELPPVQRVAGLVEVDCWVPADRLGSFEHVLNCAGDDLARVAEVSLAGRPEDGTHLERDCFANMRARGVAVIIARRPASAAWAVSGGRCSLACLRSDPRGAL